MSLCLYLPTQGADRCGLDGAREEIRAFPPKTQGVFWMGHPDMCLLQFPTELFDRLFGLPEVAALVRGIDHET